MEQARVWYGRAAEQGHVSAQFNLALMHYYGKDGPVSMERARIWYGRAAEQGHAKSQEILFRMLYQGHGGPVSTELAIFWFKRSVAQGDDDDAMRALDAVTSMCCSCGDEGENLQTCSRCKCAFYCSKDCQRSHWKSGGHKIKCKQIQALNLKMAGVASCSSGSLQ